MFCDLGSWRLPLIELSTCYIYRDISIIVLGGRGGERGGKRVGEVHSRVLRGSKSKGERQRETAGRECPCLIWEKRQLRCSDSDHSLEVTSSFSPRGTLH